MNARLLLALFLVAPLTQQEVPVVDLPAASARTSINFGGFFGVREIGGKVLVNDGKRRLLRLFDTTLTTSTLLSDSTSGSATFYGPWGVQLVPYLGDSSLFEDYGSRTLLVLNPRGDVVRSMAPPSDPAAIGSFVDVSNAGVDGKGRLIYLSQPGTSMTRRFDPTTGKSTSKVTPPPDSLALLRADLDARRVDTVDRVMRAWTAGRVSFVTAIQGKPDLMKITLNPLPEIDEFAVLSDGTVGIVRGHDYHVDWILPDGSRTSTGKLPFDWRKLTEADKQRMIDSTRTAENMDARNAQSMAVLQAYQPGAAADTPPSPPGGGGVGRGGGGGGSRGGSVSIQSLRLLDVASASELPDFLPPLREGRTLADMDGNLWIVPMTSARSRQGELVYDVISPKRGLYERVRVPIGRSVVGFGRGGVVYMASGDRVTGFVLERTRLR